MQSRRPTPARVNRIAYVNLDGQVMTMAPDGSDPRMLSRDRFFQFPAWSPDGRHIAAIGSSRSSAGIFVFEDEDALSTLPPPVYDSRGGPPIYLYWAPDSRHLTFLAGLPPQQTMGLRLVSIDGEHTGHLITTGRPCFWQWAPEGDRILLHQGFAGDNEGRLGFVNPFKPGTSIATENLDQPGLFQSPGIAPSGEHWAYARVNLAGETEIVIDGRRLDEGVAVTHFGIVALAWSPARDQLAYISPPGPARASYGPLRLLELDGSTRQISDELALAFFWSPDGNKIAYVTVATALATVQRALGLNPKPDPGGLRAAPEAATDRNLWLNLWVADLATGRNQLLKTFRPLDVYIGRYLPFFDQYAHSHQVWSPDSDAILLNEIRNDIARITVVPIDARAGGPLELANGMMPAWSCV